LGIISVSLPSDGTTADVTDYNTPITTIVNAINSGLDNANLSASASIDFSKLAASAWSSYTPTWTNFTVAASTVDAKYIQIGKIVHFKIKLTLAGGNVPSGSVSVSLPVTAISHGTTPYFNIGQGSANDGGAVVYPLAPCLTSTTTAAVFAMDASAVYAFVAATVPFTWANGDILMLSGTYEAA
jgi:hypothetical protein